MLIVILYYISLLKTKAIHFSAKQFNDLLITNKIGNCLRKKCKIFFN